jgi:hypothetical protein
MTVHLVTFSDDSMSRSAELCVDSALRNGVDRNCSVGPSQRPYTFQWLTESPLIEERSVEYWHSRGIGYWLWKPYIINREILKCDVGDILIYADAGVEFTNNVSHIIDRMDQDIFLFGNNWEHAHWCKRDIVNTVWNQDSPRLSGYGCGPSYGPLTDLLDFNVDSGACWAMFGKQCQASVIFFRVSDYSRQFVAEWLKWCLFEGGRLIDDSPSRAPNHPEFRENRHDQAILTTLAYREGLKLHYWPAVYNRGTSIESVYKKLPEYAGDDYPGPLFSHHRKRNEEWA